ncbi:MAG: AmmeMemoRadiSam system protein B [Armatimonadota bacterium]
MHDYPRLRPLEAIRDSRSGRIVLRDPTQLATGMLLVGEAELRVLTLFDGTRTRLEIQAASARERGRLLLGHELDEMLETLATAGFLDGPAFDGYYSRLVQEYREAPYRPLRDPDSYGAPAARLGDFLDEGLSAAGAEVAALAGGGRLAGIVTPHLDFPRGMPCYAAGFGAVRRLLPRNGRVRVVVLGTNHFGRSDSVVVTRKDFQTPWGVAPTDREFLTKLETACGGNLAPYELDHLHEHSVELQVIWLHHLLGDQVTVVPALCPDPSGPRGTAAGDPGGVDLRRFARKLGQLVREDPTPTLLIASADLSHVGGYFGDDCELSDELLEQVRQVDETALQLVDGNSSEEYRQHMADTGNPTKVCSVGCLYALMTALGPQARAHRLRYHQAVTPELENCVTSAAYAFLT